MQSDPIGLDGGLNTYGYVGSNPLRWFDRLGLTYLPDPNGVVPGSSWTKAGEGQRPGTWYGPKQDNGPRATCRYVPAEKNGGPKGAKEPYWKVKNPNTGGWQRYNTSGQPVSPNQAHGPRGGRGNGGGGNGGGGSSSGSCFVAGTKVLTKDGYKDIKDIKIEDIVKSFNHKLDKSEWKRVINKFKLKRNDLIRVILKDSSDEILSSSNHKYYVVGKGYIEVKEIEPNDVLMDYNKDTFVVKEVNIVNKENPVTVYNFTVEDNHNYFVSEKSILVHNTKTTPRGGPGRQW